MIQGRQKLLLNFIFAGMCVAYQPLYAFKFEPGVGVGLEHTDNAALTAVNEVDDLITAGYVGGRAYEHEGSLLYDVAAALDKHVYTQDTFQDQRYFNLNAKANWAMVKQRFNWFLKNYYNQRPIRTIDSNTPDNLQDSNAFTFGANINFPLSSRQSFSLVPLYNKYYYEVQTTDNKQYSLAANWNYQMFRLTNVGLNMSTRKIDYTEKNAAGLSISDTTFTNIGFIYGLQRQSNDLSMNLGSTNVKRDTGQESTGFSGYILWQADLNSRSKLKTNLSTELTDTSSVGQSLSGDGGTGNIDVQVSTDVIRNSLFNLAYVRDDAAVKSRYWIEYRKITYSDNPLDREIRIFGAQANRPITRLLLGGLYFNYNRTKQIETLRLDERYTIGGNLRHRFSQKVHGLLDIKYRKKESTSLPDNFDEFSVFASIVYGFGDLYRPTRAGGF